MKGLFIAVFFMFAASVASAASGKIVSYQMQPVAVNSTQYYMSGYLMMRTNCGSSLCTKQLYFPGDLMEGPEIDNLSGLIVTAEQNGDIVNFGITATTSVDLIQPIAFSGGQVFYRN